MPLHHDSGVSEIAQTFLSEKIGLAVAAGMISSPYWLQYLKIVSDVAALLAPILGCIYLLMQIGFKVLGRKKGQEDG